MKDKIKRNILPLLLGAAIVITGFLGWVFYKNITIVQEDHVRTLQLMQWACTKDPASCRDAEGNPLPTKQQNPPAQETAPTVTPATNSTQ